MQIKEFNIRDIAIAPGLILAPMSGVTNCCFRQLIKSENPGAVGLVVTEFISIEALVRDNVRSLQMMDFCESERPISVQIFGHDANNMAEAAAIAENRGADIIDINCGCPVPKVVKKGGGCELMRQPEHLTKILATVKKRITKPLTLKIRSGWDLNNRNALEIAQRAEDCGVEMLAIHGRTRTQMYRDVADWDIIDEVAKRLTIPVVGSGDIVDFESAKHALARNVSGVMIGRAALSNPWVFSEIAAGFAGEALPYRSRLDVPRVIGKYQHILLESMNEKSALGRLKQFSSQVTRLIHGSSQVRKALCVSQSVTAFSDVLKRWEDELSGEGTTLLYKAAA